MDGSGGPSIPVVTDDGDGGSMAMLTRATSAPLSQWADHAFPEPRNDGNVSVT